MGLARGGRVLKAVADNAHGFCVMKNLGYSLFSLGGELNFRGGKTFHARMKKVLEKIDFKKIF